MLKIEKINDCLTYIGALDPDLKIFDIVMETKFGTTYNSYIINGKDELALVDTAKEHYFDEYYEELKKKFDIEKIKYLIVNHTEPDHSGEIYKLLEKMPWLTIVGSPCALGFLKDIANRDFKSIEVKQDFKLKVGDKTISFIIAPNLHWPDSIFTYVEEEEILLTCDVFGAHYSTHNIFNDVVENKEDYMEAFKYYYNAVFSPFKPFVIDGLNKIKDLKLKLICPSHGPVLKENINWYKEKYFEWAKDVSQISGKVAICYTSAYGYTGRMAEEISDSIKEEGYEVTLIDLLEKTKEEALIEIKSSEAFLIGSPTINGDAVLPIWELLLSLNAYDNCGKLAGAFGAFGWSGEAVRNIENRLASIKCEVYRPGLKIKFNPNDKIKLKKIQEFGKKFAKKLESTKKVCNDEWVEIKTGKWKCLICGEIYEGEYPPEICPACGAPSDQFIEIDNENIIFQSEDKFKVLVIGSGVGAISAIENIRKRNKVCEIEMISEEEILPYYRILLSKKLTSPNAIELLKDQSWFDENNIKVSLGKKVFRIIANENKIILSNGSLINYDKLIVATGAINNIRKIPGDDKIGVFNLRNRIDYEKINEFASKDEIKKIVIVGGGILGVEMASALKAINKEITIIEYSPRIMFRQLDEDGGLIFEEHLKQNEIKIITSETIEEIYGKKDNLKEIGSVKLTHSGNKFNCDMIIEATGIKTNLEIFEKSGIKTHKGVLVNEQMKTNIPNIYACGDIVEFNEKTIGLWSIALEQGKVAGANVAGENKKYFEKPISTSFNGFGYKIFSIGDLGFEYNLEDYQIIELSDPKNEIYRKFYFKDDEFVGGILMGNTSKAVQLRKAIDMKSTMQHFLDSHFLDEQ